MTEIESMILEHRRACFGGTADMRRVAGENLLAAITRREEAVRKEANAAVYQACHARVLMESDKPRDDPYRCGVESGAYAALKAIRALIKEQP